MIIRINANGAERKRLVECVSRWLDVPAKYCGVPTFRYEVDGIYIERDGSLDIDDRTDSELVEDLLAHIYKEGFAIDQSYGDDDSNSNIEEKTGLTVSVPADKVSMENLKNLLTAKGTLIKKALKINMLPVETDGEKISFPWFQTVPDASAGKAYTDFIAALCKMSREQKQIRPLEKVVKNEKYAFRCFLLRLGFIGEEYKSTRKILLQNLTGCSAWKNHSLRFIRS